MAIAMTMANFFEKTHFLTVYHSSLNFDTLESILHINSNCKLQLSKQIFLLLKSLSNCIASL